MIFRNEVVKYYMNLNMIHNLDLRSSFTNRYIIY